MKVNAAFGLSSFALVAAMLACPCSAQANVVRSLTIILQVEKGAKQSFPTTIPVTVKVLRDSGVETLNLALGTAGSSEVPGTEMRAVTIEFPRYVPLDSIKSIDLLTRPGASGGLTTNLNPVELKVRQLCIVPGFSEYQGSPSASGPGLFYYYANDAFRFAPSLPRYFRDTLGFPELVTNKGSGSFNQTAALRINVDRADRRGEPVSRINFRTRFSDTTRRDSSFALLAETWDGRLFQVEVSALAERERTTQVDLSSPLGTGDLKAVHGLFARRGITTGNPLPPKGSLDGGDGVTYSILATSEEPRATVGSWRQIRQENWNAESHENPSNRASRPGYMRSPMKQLDKFLIWLETGDKGLDARITPELEITVKSGKVYRVPFSRSPGGSGGFFPKADPQGVLPIVLSLTEEVAWRDLGVTGAIRTDILSKEPEPTTTTRAFGIPVHAISKVGINLKWTGALPSDLVNTEWIVKNIIIAGGRRSNFDLRPDDSWTPLLVKMGWNKTFRYVLNSRTFAANALRFEERVDVSPIAYKVTVTGGVAPRVVP